MKVSWLFLINSAYLEMCVPSFLFILDSSKYIMVYNTATGGKILNFHFRYIRICLRQQKQTFLLYFVRFNKKNQRPWEHRYEYILAIISTRNFAIQRNKKKTSTHPFRIDGDSKNEMSRHYSKLINSFCTNQIIHEKQILLFFFSSCIH